MDNSASAVQFVAICNFHTTKFMSEACCVSVFRTGQCGCGRWTVTVVGCTVWRMAPTTPTPWAPSPAPGRTLKDTEGKEWVSVTMWMNLIFVSRMKASFVVSGSQDCTLKVWDLPADLSTTGGDLHHLTPRATEKAHDKVRAQNSTHSSRRREEQHLNILQNTISSALILH